MPEKVIEVHNANPPGFGHIHHPDYPPPPNRYGYNMFAGIGGTDLKASCVSGFRPLGVDKYNAPGTRQQNTSLMTTVRSHILCRRTLIELYGMPYVHEGLYPFAFVGGVTFCNSSCETVLR